MKIKHLYIHLFVISLFCIFSCDTDRLNFDKGFIPTIPTNFYEVNSEFDDYNSDLSWTFARKSFSLLFSTNRNSNGANFDFICFDCNVTSDGITGEFRTNTYEMNYKFIGEVNSTANELGPLVLFNTYESAWGEGFKTSENRFFYATDIDGNLDIRMVNCILADNKLSVNGTAKVLTEINSGFDDAYPSIYYDSLKNTEILYFTSNRAGSFDIFSAFGNENTQIDKSANIKISKVERLSSDSDDKCPYIKGNIMVFTSNRPGGFGGFDLWYSTYNGIKWSEPKNFGSKINTEYDEYRPVISEDEQNPSISNFFNNLMIFSSNRSGGKGGFDLYYVGIDKVLK